MSSSHQLQKAEGNWNQLKGRVQETWGDITDNDLEKTKGNLNQLIGLIQEKTGEAREQIEAKVHQWSSAAAEQASEVYEQVSDAVQQGYQQVESTVKQRPLESVAVAFGTGLIAGVIVGLALRSR